MAERERILKIRDLNISFKTDAGKVCNVFDYKEIEFREKNLKKLLDLGLDMWWYDRNWSTKLITKNCKKIKRKVRKLLN